MKLYHPAVGQAPKVPGQRPRNTCGERGRAPDHPVVLACNRPHGHGGRHARVWWDMNGYVRAVWEA